MKYYLCSEGINIVAAVRGCDTGSTIAFVDSDSADCAAREPGTAWLTDQSFPDMQFAEALTSRAGGGTQVCCSFRSNSYIAIILFSVRGHDAARQWVHNVQLKLPMSCLC